MDGDYFLLDKTIQYRPWYSDRNARRLYYYCLFTASWEDKIYQGVLIPRGTVLTSLTTLANDLSISVQQVRTALNKLLATHDITYKAYPKFSVVATTTSYPVSENNTIDKTVNLLEQHDSNTMDNTVDNTVDNTMDNTVESAWLTQNQVTNNTIDNTVNNTVNNTVDNTIVTRSRDYADFPKEKEEREAKEKGVKREGEIRVLEEEKERSKEREEVTPNRGEVKVPLKEKEEIEEKEAPSESKSSPTGEPKKRARSKKENPVQLFTRLVNEKIYPLSDPLYDELKEWCEYKSERNEKYTETGLNSLINKAIRQSHEYGDLTVCDVIEDSISNNYMGIVWDWLDRKRKTKKTLDDIWRDV